MHEDDAAEAILAAMKEGVLVLDDSDDTGTVCYANAPASRLLAAPVDTLVGRPVELLIPAVPARDASSDTNSETTEVALPTGTVLELYTCAISWRDRPARMVTLRDITKHKQAEMARRVSADSYQMLARNIPAGHAVYVFDRDLRNITVDAPGMAKYGFTRADFEGRRMQDVLGEEQARILGPISARTIAGEECEAELPFGSNAFQISTKPIRDEHGEVCAGLALIHDITRLKRAEQEVHELNEQLQDMLRREQLAREEAESQRALLRDIVDQAPAIMALHEGPEHEVLLVNEIYCRAVNRTPAELIGMPARMALPEIEQAGIYDLMDQVYRTGEPYHAVERLVPLDLHQDGTLHDRYFTFSYQPMRNADGQVTGIVVHAIDMTESVVARRAVEQKSLEIAALNRGLEQRVAERTAELAAANQELEAFAYSVSHDLRAPLRRIDGFSRVLLEDWGHKLDDTGWHHLSRIRVGTQHMGELIDDMLTLAQVSRQTLETEEVDLSDLAHAAVSNLREQAPEREVTVHIEPAMSARGDARFLRVVLDNLLDNAWKFTGKQDQAVVEIGEAKAKARDGEQVFFVRDNGAGFDPAFKDKLFSAFNRLHSPADFPGTGIGLATVKRVLDRHGGRIWAEGAVNEGAVFYIALPAR